MIPRKAKRCKTCQTDQLIWAYGNCVSCDGKARLLRHDKTKGKVTIQKEKKFPVRAPIKPVGTKQAKINRAYAVSRVQYLKDHPECGVRFNDCMHIASQIHHKGSGSNKRKFYLDTTTWIQTCQHCHDVIHKLSADELYTLGLKIRT